MNFKRPAQSTLSAIIINYNSADLLKKCIQSVLDQVDEIIIVDNASNNIMSLEKMLESFSNKTNLKIIYNEKNLGFATACNIGIKQTDSDYLLFLNPDCLVLPGAIAELLQVLKSDNSIAMTGALLLKPDGTEQNGGRRAVPTPWRSFVRAFGLNHFAKRWPKLFYDFHLHTQPLPKQAIEVEAISGACMLVKRVAIDQVGNWDEDYFLHCEDLDWCMRFRRKAWKIFFIPTARVFHNQGGCSQNKLLFVEWHKHKGMIRFYRKFFRHQYPSLLMFLVILGVWLRFSLIFGRQGARYLKTRLQNQL